MAEKNIKLISLDGKAIDSPELSADFRGAEKTGRFWVGRVGFYFRNGLRKVYLPLSEIDHAFTRVTEVNTHCCCGGYCMYTYRLVLAYKGRELIDVNMDEDEASVERAQALLKERVPGIRIGYTDTDKKAAGLSPRPLRA